MSMTNKAKVKSLVDFLKQNTELIKNYEAAEKEIALNKWLLIAYTEASDSPEYKNIFNRELSTIKFNLQRLNAQYSENKSEYEKKRLILQNEAIKNFINKKFGISISDENYDDLPEIIDEIKFPASVEKSTADIQEKTLQKYNLELMPKETKELPYYINDGLKKQENNSSQTSQLSPNYNIQDKKNTTSEKDPEKSRDTNKLKESDLPPHVIDALQEDFGPEPASQAESFSEKLSKYTIPDPKDSYDYYEVKDNLISAEEELYNLISEENAGEQSLYSLLSEEDNSLLTPGQPPPSPAQKSQSAAPAPPTTNNKKTNEKTTESGNKKQTDKKNNKKTKKKK